MKKRILGIFAAIACLSLASCGSDNQNKTNNPSTTISQTPSTTTSTVDAPKLKVQVLLPDGTPATGVSVQWCEESCLLPVKVDENGIATTTRFTVGINYNVHVLNLSSDYIYNQYELVQNDQNNDGVIHLYNKGEIATGDGTIANPYLISDGMYEASVISSATTYFGFTPKEEGTYIIQSYADYNKIDTAIGDYGTLPSPSYTKKYDQDSGVGKNFLYEVIVTADDVTANTVFVYGINVTAVDPTNHPLSETESFAIQISKK